MAKTYIDARNVSISYKTIQGFSIKSDVLRKSKKYDKYYEPIKDVTFSINEGEVVGLIGQNGCGKSTLLRAIAGIYKPNRGFIDVYGHSVSLMALGVGFLPDLTGRENIILSGMLQGFSKKEIESIIDSIIEFSELGEFINRPIRTYSSGMYAKLAFSITACIESDIILVDEILSVGDGAFKNKSFLKMKELIENRNRSAIIVSHEESVLKQFCNRVLWLEDGIVRENGDVGEVMYNYRHFLGIE